jgi:hypothetical protein
MHPLASSMRREDRAPPTYDSPIVNLEEGNVLLEMAYAMDVFDEAHDDNDVVRRLVPGPATRHVLTSSRRAPTEAAAEAPAGATTVRGTAPGDNESRPLRRLGQRSGNVGRSGAQITLWTGSPGEAAEPRRANVRRFREPFPALDPLPLP